jgi:hypothetical protein
LGSSQGELGEIGFAQENSSSFLQVRDRRGVLFREEVRHEPRTDGGADAFGP